MKAEVYDNKGMRKHEIELPEIFSSNIREDIALKFFEIDKSIHMQPHSLKETAGRRHSASGTISHRRHEWKGHYGKGISRVPRKAMWRRGTQFMWIATEVSGTRGGRRVHGPQALRGTKKINQKEVQIAMTSGFASTANKNFISKRYQSLEGKKLINFPVVVESKLEGIKAKDLMAMLEKIFGEMNSLVVKNREIRAGKGKNRGRRYKSSAGLLLVKGKDENIKASTIDVKTVDDLCIEDLYPLGRLVVYTEKALNELKEENKESKK